MKTTDIAEAKLIMRLICFVQWPSFVIRPQRYTN